MKKSVVSLVLAAASLPALPAEPDLDRLVSCTDIRDARERLACFDREIAPLVGARRPAPAASPPRQVARNTAAAPATPPPAPASAAPSSPTPPSPAAPPPPAPAQSAPAATRSFGEEQLQRRDRAEAPREEQELHARIERLRAVTASDFIVYLDNGQAWRHQDQVLGGYLRVGDAITITRGTLGSYRLSRDAGSSKNWIRVTRIK